MLGSGSFAQVYLAIDTFNLNRLACKAIKTKGLRLRESKILEKEFQRIVQEVRVLKQIDHPNIVSIHDSSLSADGSVVYLFLTRVMGGELFDKIIQDDGIPEIEVM